jgi:hypothetical protein
MKAKLPASSAAIALIAFSLFVIMPTTSAQDNSFSYKLINQTDGTFSYTLNVIVPQSLNDYYHELNHRSAVDTDFPKFVTPYALKPIADALRQIYPDDEDFANGVLTLVHQIPYEETVPQFYPTETLLRNKGDCDMFSLLAVSIMKAGGLDVILVHYTSEEHMNIGVHLESPPKDARLEVYSFEYSGATYYVGECTSSTWKEGWRVGECPDDLKNAPIIVVTLENSEQIAPGQVSASFEKLQTTTLTMSISPFLTIEGSTLTVDGQIYPVLPNQNVTLYCSVNGGSWKILAATLTQTNGQFTYLAKSDATGELRLRASWLGDDQYAGTTSGTKNTIILPYYLVALAALAAIAIVCAVIFAFIKRKKPMQQITQSESYTYEI